MYRCHLRLHDIPLINCASSAQPPTGRSAQYCGKNKTTVCVNHRCFYEYLSLDSIHVQISFWHQHISSVFFWITSAVHYIFALNCFIAFSWGRKIS